MGIFASIIHVAPTSPRSVWNVRSRSDARFLSKRSVQTQECLVVGALHTVVGSSSHVSCFWHCCSPCRFLGGFVVA